MKTKKFKKRLSLSKFTVANLNAKDENAIIGGLTVQTNCDVSCMDYSYCYNCSLAVYCTQEGCQGDPSWMVCTAGHKCGTGGVECN